MIILNFQPLRSLWLDIKTSLVAAASFGQPFNPILIYKLFRVERRKR
jgi:hypothetical protein